MSNPVVVTLDQFNTARSDFQARYFLSGCGTGFGGQEIQILWGTLSSAVSNFISNNNVAAADVALRFVYCYDSAGTALYLRLQILTMTKDVDITSVYNLNPTPCAWYKITDGSMTTTQTTTLSDSAYLSDFYYCNAIACSEASLHQLSGDTSIYAQNCVFPWSTEIEALYTDNGSPTDASIVFAAVSFQAAASAPVLYPHSLALYLKNSSGKALLNNIAGTGFENKAADFSTLCPLTCGVYISPTV